jgi:EAL domain-containing protein (putative c-di-GMP-specific phosphodiesterase class I)
VSRQAVIAGLVHFAAVSGALIIAEGIETKAEAETVKRLGVRLGQGYLLGRPAPVEHWRVRPAGRTPRRPIRTSPARPAAADEVAAAPAGR